MRQLAMKNSATVKKIQDNFTRVPNTWLKDTKLSAKAKGLICFLQSTSNNWKFTIEGLATQFSDGRESIRNGIKELEKAGYIKWTQVSNNSGKFDKNVVELFEHPFTGFPSTEKPSAGKPLQQTKDLQTKDLQTNTPAKADEYIFKLAYDFMKDNKIPIINHTIFRSQIRTMWKTLGNHDMATVLIFLRDCYKECQDREFAPVISDYIDISRKAKKILNWAQKMNFGFDDKDYQEF